MGDEERWREMVASRDDAEMDGFDIRVIGRVRFNMRLMTAGRLVPGSVIGITSLGILASRPVNGRQSRSVRRLDVTPYQDDKVEARHVCAM